MSGTEAKGDGAKTGGGEGAESAPTGFVSRIFVSRRAWRGVLWVM